MLDINRIGTDLYFNNTTTKADKMQCIPYYRNDTIDGSKLVTMFRFGDYSIIDCDTAGGETYLALDVRNEVTYYRQIRKHTIKYLSHARFDDLVKNQWVEPLLVFINGRFIKWTDIYLYDDNVHSYFLMDTKDIMNNDSDWSETKIDILHLPFFVSYTEDNEIFEDKDLIFIFDDLGYYNYEGHTRLYMNRNDNLWFMEGRSALGSIKKYDLDLPDEYHIYPDNVFIFRNGLLDRNAEVKIDNYNAIYVDNGEYVGSETITYKIFRDLSTTLEARNIDSIPNHDYLKHLEYNDKMIEMFKILNTEFDYKFDQSLTYNENVRKFIIFAARYNYRYFIDEIKYNNTKIVTYQLPSLWANIDGDGCVTLPYPQTFYSSCFPLVFIDGYMCNRFIKKYGKNEFVFKLSEIGGTSFSMEIIFFRSYWNRPCVPFKYNENNMTSYVFTDVRDIDIFSKYHPDKCFDMDDESKCFYTVDKSKYNYSGNVLTFTDDTYANKDLILAPRQRIVYSKFIIPTNNYRIVLGDNFNYCNTENLFMIFINGSKLNSALYRVVLPSPVRPFNSRSIYFHRMLKAGDIVEIIYSSMTVIDEVYIKDLNHSSEIGTGVDSLGYITGPAEYPVPLSKKLQFFFINGRKIHSAHLKDLSYNMMRITKDYKSIEDLCIINFECDIFEEIEDLKVIKSLLDDTYAQCTKSEINNLTNTYAYISSVDLSQKADFSKEAIIHQIIKDYYVHVNNGVPFRYTYDKDTYTEVDAAGNIILDVIDGTKYKSLEAKEVDVDG